jgi:hypothetical protein
VAILARTVPVASTSGEQSLDESTSSAAETFSITRGGPLHRLVRLGQAGDGRPLVVRRALAVVLITWLPLLLLWGMATIQYKMGHLVF